MSIYNRYRNLFNLNPPLQVIRQPFKDREKEKMRNRFPLATLIRQTPKTYTVSYNPNIYLRLLLQNETLINNMNNQKILQGLRFTSEATITGLNTCREWYYKSCNTCTLKVDKNGDVYECRVHGPVSIPVNR